MKEGQEERKAYASIVKKTLPLATIAKRGYLGSLLMKQNYRRFI